MLDFRESVPRGVKVVKRMPPSLRMSLEHVNVAANLEAVKLFLWGWGGAASAVDFATK
jgi:hypothetical protein